MKLYVKKRLSPLSSLIPDETSPEALANHAPWELSQAAVRAATCARCPMSGGACDGETGYYGEGIVPEWREGMLEPRPCERWPAFARRRHLGHCGLPPAFLDASFTTYHPQNDTQQHAVLKVMQYARHAVPGDRMLIVGPTGVGKSHLAAAAVALIADRASVSFSYVPDFIETVRREMLQGSSVTMDRALTVDFLVLDDLGAERGTDFVREKLEMLLNTRLVQKRSIIFTQNVSPDQLAQSLGQPVMRRVLYETDTVVEIHGRPYG